MTHQAPSERPTNHLRDCVSPYLQQHASNPVDWYPWCGEAFERARHEDKLVFLSIGYSTCHWCHVMERESFEAPEVAALLNAHFVAIKVDREEQPDVDQYYMTVCQIQTGAGGWPLTVILTPDRRAILTGTYFPKKSLPGRIGMLDLLPRLIEAWENNRHQLLQAAEQTAGAIEALRDPKETTIPDPSVFDGFIRRLKDRFDGLHGGFSRAPKFPMPHQLLSALQFAHANNDPELTEMALQTLRQMRRGGIYDQIGGGFHRYSTDREWLVPHFEKMLYDQALHILALTEAFAVTGENEWRRTIEDVVVYVQRDLKGETPGFFAAEDADSEGEEGRFYVWTEQELRGILSANEFDWITKTFGVEPGGNWRDEASGRATGSNVLHLSGTAELPSRDVWEPIRGKLLECRTRRQRPLRDKKILTDWNGLMVAALGRAGRVLDRSEYVASAVRTAEFLLDDMSDDDGGLYHRHCAGETAISGNLNDYAFLIFGLLEIHRATFDVKWLTHAIRLQGVLDRDFADPHGGYFLTAEAVTNTPTRMREDTDGAIPSGNTVGAWNCMRLSALTGNPDYETTGRDAVRALAPMLRAAPDGMAVGMLALRSLLHSGREIVVVGQRSAAETQEFLAVINRTYDPDATVLLKPLEDAPACLALAKIAPFTTPLKAVDGRPTVYICRNRTCQQPITDPEVLREELALE